MARFFSQHAARIAFGLLVALYLFANLAFTTWTERILLIKDLGAPLIALMILATWILHDLARGRAWTLPRHGIVVPTVVALLGWLISVPLSPATYSSVIEWGRTACYFITLWSMIRFVDDPARLRIVLRTVVGANAFIVLYGLAQLVGYDPLVEAGLIEPLGAGAFVSTHGNPNFLAGYIVTTLPLLCGLALTTRTAVGAAALGGLVLLNLYELIETTARGAYLAVLVTLPLFALVLILTRRYRPANQPGRKMRAKAAGALALVVLLIGAVNGDRISRLGSQVERQFESLADFESNYTNRVRIIFWRTALDAAVRAPWSGVGIGVFNQVMPETRPSDYYRTGVSHNTIHAHNEHLEWLAETGVPGLALFWWILAAYAATTLRSLHAHRGSARLPVLLGASLGPFALWIQSTFDVETRWTGNSITLWWMVGLALSLGRTFPSTPITLEKITTRDSEVAEIHSRGRNRANGIFPTSSPSLPWAAACLFLIALFYGHRALLAFQADHERRTVSAFTDEAVAQIYPQALDAGLRIARLVPEDYAIHYKLAFIHLYKGRLEDALAAYRTLQSLAPNYAQVHMNIAYVQNALGRLTAAAWEYDRMAALENNTRNHRQAAQAWRALGYPARAMPHLRTALTIDLDRTPEGYFFWHERDAIQTEIARISEGAGEIDRQRDDHGSPGNARSGR